MGPGFLSTSPAINSNTSTTIQTWSSKATPQPTLTAPLASPLWVELPSTLEQHTLPHPPRMQPWNRGVLFTISHSPSLAASTLHWTSRAGQPTWPARLPLDRERAATGAVVVEPNSSSPRGEIDSHFDFRYQKHTQYKLFLTLLLSS